jgi:RimJ/RimL family protein N-acetyltransferase
MLDAAKYSSAQRLRNGRRVEIRALKPTDEADLVAAMHRASAQSAYRRFFGARRNFSPKEIAFFVNVDFASHVALVAIVEENDQATIVGGARYIVVRPGSAEVAFVVIDAYQAQGIGAALMFNLVIIARDAGLTELTAEVLDENAPMLKVLERCGLKQAIVREDNVIHVTLGLY